MYLAKSIAASGLRNQQLRIDTIASNVANVNTNGYKNARLDFKDSLYTAGFAPSPARSINENIQKGHGVLTGGITRDFKPGIIQRTDRELDFGIEGEGFFSLALPDGSTVYTRGGNFNLSAEVDGTYLVSSNGYYVLNDVGGRIMIPPNTDSIEVYDSGLVQFRSSDNIIGQTNLGMFTFRNLKGLEAVGDGNYIPTAIAGERIVADRAIIRQGTLEGSNVNLAEEMTRLIRAQRAFQLSSRALTTADEMQGIANNMRR